MTRIMKRAPLKEAARGGTAPEDDAQEDDTPEDARMIDKDI